MALLPVAEACHRLVAQRLEGGPQPRLLPGLKLHQGRQADQHRRQHQDRVAGAGFGLLRGGAILVLATVLISLTP